MAAVAAGAHADWLDDVARALGISKTPSAMKSAADEMLSGDIYLAAFDGNPPVRVTRDGGYRSPVFAAGDNALLALKGSDLVSVPLAGGGASKRKTLPGAVKLLGVDQNDADRLLLLAETAAGGSELATLSLKNGTLTPLPHARDAKEQRRLLSHLRGDNRSYGDLSLYLKIQSRRELAITREWSDVYLERRDAPALNLSRCDGDNCGQPALSHDRARVVFIRAAQRP
jgi:hypothetical protein